MTSRNHLPHPPPAGGRPPPPATQIRPERHYQPGDPIPVPDVIEDDPELAWKLWQASHDEQANGYADTQPLVHPEDGEDTQPMGLP